MPDQELLEQVARALRPGAVEPPARHVKQLRRLVAASAQAQSNGAGTAVEGELIGDVARALRPGALEPPPDRVEAVRRLVTTPAAAGDDATAGTTEAAHATAPAAAETDSALPAGVADLHAFQASRARKVDAGRLSRMVAGLCAAAAVAVLVAMVAVNQLPGALRGVAHDVGLPVDSPERAAAERDVDRLALALARQNSDEVAEADAAMLRSTSKLSGDDLRELRNRAVRLHVEAIAFLRDNPTPNALSDLPSPEAPAPGTPLSPDQAAPAPQGSTGPAADPPVIPPAGSTGKSPTVPTTVPPQAPSVTIVSVLPRLDASFEVNFEVAGFTPGPGQPYIVHFFFDDGQDLSSYSGSSPWTFPLLKAVKYRTVCAQVADAAGVRNPATGSCKSILLT